MAPQGTATIAEQIPSVVSESGERFEWCESAPSKWRRAMNKSRVSIRWRRNLAKWIASYWNYFLLTWWVESISSFENVLVPKGWQMSPLNGFSTGRYLSGSARSRTSRNNVGLERFAKTFGSGQNEPLENKKKEARWVFCRIIDQVHNAWASLVHSTVGKPGGRSKMLKLGLRSTITCSLKSRHFESFQTLSFSCLVAVETADVHV